MPTTISHVAVVVPVRNESETIADTLDAVDAARRHLPGEVSSSCVVVLDACDDDTGATIARQTGALGCRVVVIRERCVGVARAVGVSRALTSAHLGPSRIWLANTDADTVVPRDWLTQQLDLARDGVDAVAGIVELAAGPLTERFLQTYRVDFDGHSHVHGANLGVRASTYLAAGGWRPMHTGEDHDLWNRISTTGANRLSSATLTVRTSARTRGRAPDGFAADLAAMDATVVVA